MPNSYFVPATSRTNCILSWIMLCAVVAWPVVLAQEVVLVGSIEPLEQHVPDLLQPDCLPQASESLPGFFEIPGTKFKIRFGGYVKVDLIHDFDAIQSTDAFNTRTIFTDGRDGQNTRLHARQTRLNMEAHHLTELGDLKLFIEGDFFGSENSFRLRHGYGELGSFLVGQTWSTFMNVNILPSTLDFESPTSALLVRQAMVRWTTELSDDVKLALAVEDPAANITPPTGIDGKAHEPLPDLIGRLRQDGEWGHWQLASFVGRVGFDPDVGSEDVVTIWGVGLTGILALGDCDEILYEVAYGDGIGRYRSGLAAAPDTNNRLEPFTVFAWLAGLRHNWTDKLQSSAVYSFAEGVNTAGQAPDAEHRAEYVAVNLIWSPLEKIDVGVEYLYGTDEHKDGSFGDAHRIQFSVWYYFP